MHLTKKSLFFCALTCATAYSFADQPNDIIAFGDKGSPKILMAEKNVLVVQNDASKASQPIMPEIQPATSPTPSSMARLQGNHCCEPFLTVDYLLWTVRQDNMSFSFPAQLLGPFGQPTSIKNKIHYLDYEWSSGFRVGAGLNFKHDGWDTYLNYTWFHPGRAEGRESLKDPADTLVPTWPISLNPELLLIPNLNKARAHWSFEFNNLDWELGRNFYISRYLTLRPFIGLKSAWQEQKHFISFERATKDRKFTMKNEVDFWGIGARLGMDTAWYVYKKNLSIVGDFALSALWSCYVQRQKQFTRSDTKALVANFRDSYHAIRPVLEFDIGMQWESWFYNDKMKFSFRAVWEEQIWISQNTLPEALIAAAASFPALGATVSYKARGGDLFLQGLTLRARFDF